MNLNSFTLEEDKVRRRVIKVSIHPYLLLKVKFMVMNKSVT